MGTYIYAESQCKKGNAWVDTYSSFGPLKSSELSQLFGWGKSNYLADEVDFILSKHNGAPEVLFSSEFEWDYDYGRNWFMGSELIALMDSGKTIPRRGYLSRKEFLAWDGKTELDSYSGNAWGKTVHMAAANKVDDYDCVLVTWESTLSSVLGTFGTFVREEVAEHGDVRIVYGFDQ